LYSFFPKPPLFFRRAGKKSRLRQGIRRKIGKLRFRPAAGAGGAVFSFQLLFQSDISLSAAAGCLH